MEQLTDAIKVASQIAQVLVYVVLGIMGWLFKLYGNIQLEMKEVAKASNARISEIEKSVNTCQNEHARAAVRATDLQKIDSEIKELKEARESDMARLHSRIDQVFEGQSQLKTLMVELARDVRNGGGKK